MIYIGNFQDKLDYYSHAGEMEYPAIVTVKNFDGEADKVMLPDSYEEVMSALPGFTVSTSEDGEQICLGMWTIYADSVDSTGNMLSTIKASIPQYVDMMYIDGAPVDPDAYVYEGAIGADGDNWIQNIGFVYTPASTGSHTVYFLLKDTTAIGEDPAISSASFSTKMLQCGHLSNVGKTYKDGVAQATRASVYIPASIRAIGYAAFAQSNISNITFEQRTDADTLKICRQAFYMAFMDDITVPAQLAEMGADAFRGVTCNNIMFAEPSCLKTIPARCFRESANDSIVIPEGVETIEEYAMFRFTARTEPRTVTLPSTLKKFGAYLFSSTPYVDVLYYNGTQADWDAIEKGANNTWTSTLTPTFLK